MSYDNDFFQSNNNQNITKIKDYTIIKRIGFGSSGLVYQVYKTNDPNKTTLILKQIPFRNTINDFEQTSQRLEKAKNESIILSNLYFKYVVKYYDSFIEEDCLNIIMEYCEEGDFGSYINNLIQKKNYLSEHQIWHFFIQISLGLAYIHSKNILHRDLKPMNIFLKKNNLIKIGDLGVAKILQTNTKAFTYIGTPYYLSPEVCEGKPYNSKSDVWALGCILYELCTFQKPFNAFNQAALCMKIIEGKFKPINKIENIPKYSKTIENMINWMLKKNYRERPLMKEIINDISFFKKAVALGYEKDIKTIYNNYNIIHLKNNIIIKNIQINNIPNLNTKEQYSNRDYQNEIKKSIPAKSRENKIKRINSSGICNNKKRKSIQSSINNMIKNSKNSSSKNSCKKYKTKYKIYPSGDKKKSKSLGKNTIETSHNYNRNSKKLEQKINMLTTNNNYEENKLKNIIPRQRSKKIMIRNNLINNCTEKNKLIKCKSNYNNNISSINNKINKKKDNKFIEEREIIKYIHKSKTNINNIIKNEYSFHKSNLFYNPKDNLKDNNFNKNKPRNNIFNENRKDTSINNNINKDSLNKNGIKIISIDKKYISINKTSINNSKNKTRKKIISNNYVNNSKKISRDIRQIQKNNIGNAHQSSDNLFKKHKNSIEIDNSNNTYLNGTQIKLRKNIINGKNNIDKYSSSYIRKDPYAIGNKISENNQIDTENNPTNKENNPNPETKNKTNVTNSNYFELNHNYNGENDEEEKLVCIEKPKLEELFTITKNNTSDRTDNDFLIENYYKSNFGDSNMDINITRTEEDNDDNEEKVAVLKKEDNMLKEKINKKKEEFIYKYNEIKKNIFKYKNIINIEKLFSLYELISKDKDRSENIIKDIENYLITNLPPEFYKQFHKLFNNFIFYDIEITNINRLQEKFL